MVWGHGTVHASFFDEKCVCVHRRWHIRRICRCRSHFSATTLRAVHVWDSLPFVAAALQWSDTVPLSLCPAPSLYYIGPTHFYLQSLSAFISFSLSISCYGSAIIPLLSCIFCLYHKVNCGLSFEANRRWWYVLSQDKTCQILFFIYLCPEDTCP